MAGATAVTSNKVGVVSNEQQVASRVAEEVAPIKIVPNVAMATAVEDVGNPLITSAFRSADRAGSQPEVAVQSPSLLTNLTQQLSSFTSLIREFVSGTLANFSKVPMLRPATGIAMMMGSVNLVNADLITVYNAQSNPVQPPPPALLAGNYINNQNVQQAVDSIVFYNVNIPFEFQLNSIFFEFGSYSATLGMNGYNPNDITGAVAGIYASNLDYNINGIRGNDGSYANPTHMQDFSRPELGNVDDITGSLGGNRDMRKLFLTFDDRSTVYQPGDYTFFMAKKLNGFGDTSTWLPIAYDSPSLTNNGIDFGSDTGGAFDLALFHGGRNVNGTIVVNQVSSVPEVGSLGAVSIAALGMLFLRIRRPNS